MSGVVSGAAVQAKAASRSYAVSAGIPAEIFDTFDELTTGASQAFDTHSVQSLLTSKGISLAHGVVNQLGGTKALADATGIAPGAVDVVLGVVATGKLPDIGTIASVIGAAAGTAICGPLCGVVGGAVGTLAVELLGSFGVDLGSMFGGESKEKIKFEQERIIANAVEEIKEQLFNYTNSLVRGLYYGIARIYNQMLGLGVQDFDPAQVVYEALLPFRHDRFSYYNARGYQPEDGELANKQRAFVSAVFAAANSQFSNLWNRNQDESGFTTDVKPWLFDRGSPRREQVHYGTNVKVWCTFRDAGYTNVPEQNSSAYGNEFGGQNSSSEGYPPDIYLGRWRCDNQTQGPGGQHYRDWLRGAIEGYGKAWSAVASRDCAVIQLKASIDKAKSAQAADAQVAAAAATREQAAAAYMASIGAQQAQTKGAQQYIDSVNALRAEQARAAATAAATSSYLQQVTQLQQTQQLAQQALVAQEVSRKNILEIWGAWSTTQKIVVAGSAVVLVGVVTGVAIFLTRHKPRIAA
jgi:hypothetical protein